MNQTCLEKKHHLVLSFVFIHLVGYKGLFTDWFEHFIDFTKPTAESPVLLILDGHYSHTRNIWVIELARKNHVIIISLPPHTSDKLQPLDRTFMSSFKAYYGECVRRFTLHNGRPPQNYDITELFREAYIKSMQGLYEIKGFKVTGIYPYNPDIWDNADFIVEEQSDYADTSEPIQSNSSSIHADANVPSMPGTVHG